MYDVPRHDAPESACLVGFDLPANIIAGQNVSFAELTALALTAGARPVAELICKRAAIHPAYFIGKGKAEELVTLCREHDLHLVLVDHDLAPGQARNLEQMTNAKIIDRTGLILQIFAQRARSRAGKLQVELAQLEYLLPRLTHLWSHFSRQYGGLGTRGPGETQLEVDRRRVQLRIRRLHEQLESVRKQHAVQRIRRQRADIPLVALVGYTNAGKSTLLHTLTDADVLIEDKLFATLDPTSRICQCPTGERFIFTDTVGFIRNLPHGLVAAFKATLEETERADVLLHIADGTAIDLASQIAAVNVVLRAIGVDQKPTVLALNKVDKLSHHERRELHDAYPDAAMISAQYGYGFNDLFGKLRARLPATMTRLQLRIPFQKSLLVSQLYEHGEVVTAQYAEDAVLVDAYVPEHMLAEVRRYRARQPQ